MCSEAVFSFRDGSHTWYAIDIRCTSMCIFYLTECSLQSTECSLELTEHSLKSTECSLKWTECSPSAEATKTTFTYLSVPSL